MRSDIVEWLHRSGYPLELRVGNLLRDAGWSVEHARWYTDPETTKPRELDVYARLSDGKELFDSIMNVMLAIECKSSVEKPWVVFTAPRTELPFLSDHRRVADALSRELLWRARDQTIPRPSILTRKLPVGHGIVKAHGTDKAGDPTGPYAALRGVVTAAAAIGRENTQFLLEENSIDYGQIILPVVVFEGDLFEYRIASDGSELLAEIDAAQVITRVDPTTSVDVTVVRSTRFEALYCSATAEVRAFCDALQPHVSGLATAMRAREHEPTGGRDG